MSDLLKLYGQKIAATFAANKAFFKRHLPGLHAMLEHNAGGVDIQAHVSEDGAVELSLDGNPLLLTDLLQQGRETMATFESDQRPCIIVRPKEGLPTGEPHPDDHVKRYFISDLDYRVTNAAEAAFARTCSRENALDRPCFGEKDIPILIVFGSGYGSHLIELLDRFRVRHLIIVDNDPAITRLSMGFTDYLAIYNNHLLRDGIKFSMMSHSDPETLVNMIASAIQASWPPYFVHGVAVFRNLRNIALCEKVEQGLAEKLWLAYRGWGFYDDELLSIRHTIANLNAGRKVCKVINPIDKSAPVFVVANGPSLDTLADVIRQHQDEAIIVSCGTALGSLYRLGIQPDFHAEIERTYSTVESIKYVVPEEFRAKITAVCSNALHPEVFDGFAEGLMFLKGGDTSADSFPEGYLHCNTFPTVTNGVVSWLLGLGFKNLYLFGTDLGAKDAAKHHSQHSLYYDEETMPEEYTKQVKKGDTIHMTMEADANFGDGKVRTNDILTLARLTLENTIPQHADAQVFNLSDGVRIKGTKPLPVEEFVLPETHPAKSDVIAQVHANFVHPENFDATNCRDAVAADMRAIVDSIRPLLTEEANTKIALVEKMAKIYSKAQETAAKHQAAWWALRGSMLHLQRRIYEYVSYVADDAAACTFGKDAHEIFGHFLEEAIESITSIDPATPVPEVGAQRTLREVEEKRTAA